MRRASLVVLSALAIGCGGSESDNRPGVQGEKSDSGGRVLNKPAEPTYSAQQVSERLGLSGPQGNDLGDEECVASVILTTPKEIEVYAGAGDTVATNDAGTVGVKVGTYQGGPSTAECARRFAKLLTERLP